jgi:hypothetical protein
MPEVDVRTALRVIASASLSSSRGITASCDRETEQALLAGISRERISGLALAAVHAGDIELSSQGYDELLSRHEHQLALDLRLEQLLILAAGVLERHHVEFRALKGPVLAHTVYATPELRSFGDIDLLVPGAQFDHAIAVLRPLGFERRFVEPRRGFDARFAKGSCLERGDGMELDLHRTLAPGAFGTRLAMIDFFARPARDIEIGGARLPGVDRDLAFLHACVHAALGDFPPRLVPIRDVVQCLDAGVDAEAITRLTTTARCEYVVQRAIELAEEELGAVRDDPITNFARGYRPTRFDRWALRGYTHAGRSYSRQLAPEFCALPSLRERASYAAALAFPKRSYVRAREGGYARRVSRGVRLLLDRRPA